ncbi:hypothetical protein FB451DRAFT_1181990 [Mycena latifolia]|nr:hypothetical protein FB451DRAFT_1181990 [Mycena latifolia]
MGTEVSLHLGFEASVPLDLVQTTSNLASFEVHLNCPNAGYSRQVLSDITKHITFPHMSELYLFSGIEAPPVEWPHHDFLSLASRSSFSTTLTVLQLNIIKISEGELLDVLSVLRTVEKLTIVDDDSEAGPTSISNELFRRLLYNSKPTCLVPALQSLVFGTLLQFDEHTYLDLIISRLRPTRRFRSHILWLPGYERELCAEVMAKLGQLVRQRELWFVVEVFKPVV